MDALISTSLSEYVAELLQSSSKAEIVAKIKILKRRIEDVAKEKNGHGRKYPTADFVTTTTHRASVSKLIGI